MAKAASPIRLQAELMDDATLTGKRQHRSATEQVEYWADLGRKVSNVLDPDTLLSISAGLTRMKVEPVYGQPVNPEDVFSKLEHKRQLGILSDEITKSPVRYQKSLSHPGFLERVGENNEVSVGKFSDGKFVPEESVA